MPEWLLVKDDYVPKKDNDIFIKKSIMSILGMLTKFRSQTDYKVNRLGANALMKFITVLLSIILVSLTKNFVFVLIIHVWLLVLINFLRVDEIKSVLKAGFVAAAFTLIIFLPSVFLGYGNNSLMVVMKVLASVTMVSILACTTQWNDLICALKVFHIPDIFIFVLDTTIKHIIILGEFSLNMVYALRLRSIGRNNDKNTSISAIMGTLFIKSKEMSEEMYGAMECRGFTGEYKLYRKFTLKYADYICIMFNIIFISLFFYLK